MGVDDQSKVHFGSNMWCSTGVTPGLHLMECVLQQHTRDASVLEGTVDSECRRLSGGGGGGGDSVMRGFTGDTSRANPEECCGMAGSNMWGSTGVTGLHLMECILQQPTKLK